MRLYKVVLPTVVLAFIAAFVALIETSSTTAAPAVGTPATRPTIRWITVGLSDGKQWAFGISPKVGESPISDEIEAVLESGFRPVATTKPTTVPVVIDPPIDPPTTRPVMSVFAPPASATIRGDGINLADPKYRVGGKVVFRDAWVKGFRQNVVVENVTVPVELYNVRSLDAWRDRVEERFMGNGYFVGKGVKVTMVGCLSDGNGWRNGEALAIEFRHGGYFTWLSDVTAVKCIFSNNAGCGIQFKGAGSATDCLIVNNGSGIQTLKGPVTVRRCLIFDGHRWAIIGADGKVAAFSGDIGVQNYGPMDIDNLVVAGGSKQMADDPPSNIADPSQSYDGKALNGSSKYPGNVEAGTPPTGAVWKLGSVYVSNWRGGATGGDQPPGGRDVGYTPKPYTLPPGAEAKLNALVQQARTTDRPIEDIIDEAFEVAKVPWLH